MTIWVPELTMMLLATGALLCFIVPMEAGKIFGVRNVIFNNLGEIYFCSFFLDLFFIFEHSYC